MKNERSLIAALLASAAMSLPAMAQQATDKPTTDIGKIGIEGTASTAPGAGNIIVEDSPKQRSTVTEAAIARQPASSNVFQLMKHAPGVNAQSTDGTGLFGGQLSIRGFNSDEIGFTVAGVPVNDSGNYAVFPQEYVDTENLQEIDITQGAPDPDQPQGGAVGGAASIIPQEPTDKFRMKIVQSIGQLGFFKSFGRIDTGKIAGTELKAFLSYSKAQTDRFDAGKLGADRDHIDAGAVWESSGGSKFSFYSIYNSAINYSYRSPTLAQYGQYGRAFANEPNFIPFAAAKNGTVQNQGATVAGATSINLGQPYQYTNFQGFRVNPFNNEIASFTADIKLLDNVQLSIQPYYWNGYGNGGGFATIGEAAGNTNLGVKAGTDLNGDGDKIDTIGYYRPSITSTERPGVNTKLTYQPLDWDTIRVGLQFDHSRHHQTQPFEVIDQGSGQVNVWANDGVTLLQQNTGIVGDAVQGRNQLTYNDTTVAFLQNTASFLNDALKLNTAIKRQEVLRSGHNGLPRIIALGNPAYINPEADYVNYLPEADISYQINPTMQVYTSLQKTARAPSNFTLYEGGGAITPSVLGTIGDQVQETSWNLDVGYRYHDSNIIAGIDFFGKNFSNRQLNFTLPNDPTTTSDINAGTVHGRGISVEVGTAQPIFGFNFYASGTYDKETIQSDLQVLKGTVPTRGKVYPNSPRWIASIVAEYSPDFLPGAFINLSPQFTSSRYSTLVNDQKLSGFTQVDLSAGYQFPEDTFQLLHNAKIQLNVVNLLDRDYLFFGYGASSSGIYSKSFTSNGVNFNNPTTPTYSVGAPRFLSVQLTSEF
jgi:iron complex outermembrane receptor protein